MCELKTSTLLTDNLLSAWLSFPLIQFALTWTSTTAGSALVRQHAQAFLRRADADCEFNEALSIVFATRSSESSITSEALRTTYAEQLVLQLRNWQWQ